MTHRVVSAALAVLGGVTALLLVSSLFAGESPPDQGQVIRPVTASASSEQNLQCGESFKAVSADEINIQQEIRELHFEVQLLRQDVARLIDLLEERPTGAGASPNVNAKQRPPSMTPMPRQLDSDIGRELEESDPKTVSDIASRKRWDVTLNEAVRIALANTKAIRDLGIVLAHSGDSAVTLTNSAKRSDVPFTEKTVEVQKRVSKVEEAYWKLWHCDRSTENLKAAQTNAQVHWRTVYALSQKKLEKVTSEVQAREQYFFFRSALDHSMSCRNECEQELRQLLGLARSDDRLIRPTDEPPAAPTKGDWNEACSVMLAKDPELRKQRHVVHRYDLELIAAQDGLPKKFQDLPDEGVSEVADLIRLPAEHRKTLAGVRQQQLKLATEQVRLEELMLNKCSELAKTFRSLDFLVNAAQTHSNRVTAAKDELDAATDLYAGGKVVLERLLDAQRRHTQAERDLYQAILDRARAVMDINLKTGVLLESRGVELINELSSEKIRSGDSSAAPDSGGPENRMGE